MKTRILILMVCLSGASLHAQSFEHFGARAMGMGGAFVAVASDSSAVYWNPAAFSMAKSSSVSVTTGVAGSEENHAIDDVKSLVDMNLAAHGRIITPADISRALALLESLSAPRTGVEGRADLDFVLQYQGYGFSVLALGGAEANPVIDTSIFSFDPHSGQPLPTDLPKLDFRGLLVREYVVTYSYNLAKDYVWAGGNLKLIQGSTYYDSRLIVDPDNHKLTIRDVVDAATHQNKVSSTKWGLDAGVLVALTNELRFGVVGRDINTPKFNNVGPWSAELNPQYRMGLSYWFGHSLVLASDFDLSINSLGVPGLAERELAFGGEGRLFNQHLAIRGGMCRNINVENSPWRFSFGVGFDSSRFAFDVGAMTDRKTTQVAGSLTGSIKF